MKLKASGSKFLGSGFANNIRAVIFASPFSGDSQVVCDLQETHAKSVRHTARYHQTVTDNATCTKLKYCMLSIRGVAHLTCTSLICRNCSSKGMCTYVNCLRSVFQILAVPLKVSISQKLHCTHSSHVRQGLCSM